MQHQPQYLFTSARLGFRNWMSADVEAMFQINSDEKVMEFFPSLVTKAQTIDFIDRMKTQFTNKGFCYFAIDQLEDNKFIGFIGLSEQTYDAGFTPCIDIGWRIKRSEWYKGLATEGAKRCLEYAREALSLKTVFAMAPKINRKSEQVMIKIGMKKQYEFEHPLLENDERLTTCVLYKVDLA